VFHFTPDQPDQPGDRLVDRVQQFEFNLAVQRGDQQQAARTLMDIIGWWLNRRAR
jgi:hypothetical protein